MQELIDTTSVQIGTVTNEAATWSFNWDNVWNKTIEYGTNIAISIAILIIGMIIH